jgi:hypothetical protein
LVGGAFTHVSVFINQCFVLNVDGCVVFESVPDSRVSFVLETKKVRA